jgi:osmotically inducible lipoprotein OsmB
MKNIQKYTFNTLATVIFLTLMGCNGMSRQGQGTLLGTGAGALGGAAITGGSPLGTIGGAAVGGVIGHEVSKPKK